MKKLIAYINGLPLAERDDFAARCGTTINSLRTAVSAGKKIGADRCIVISRESGGAVRCEDLRPDVDWAFVRQSAGKGGMT